MKDLSKFEQEAYDRLRETLGFSEDVDLYQVLCNANARINRLQNTLGGTYDLQKIIKEK